MSGKKEFLAESINESNKSESQEPLSIAESCPAKKWIELRYLHCDETPVKGAKYHIRAIGYSNDGNLDSNGFVRIEGVPDTVQNFQYWFDKDPETYKPKGQIIPASAGAAEAASVFDEVGVWIWGTFQGDFNKNQSMSQIAVNTLLGLIPVVDQALDLRDVVAGSKDIIDFYSEDDYKRKSYEDVLGIGYEKWIWINVFIIALGAIPIFGSAVKGVLKSLLHYLAGAGKAATKLSPIQLRHIWEELLKVLNYFAIKQGNAHVWLEELPAKISQNMDKAALNIRAALNTISSMVENAGNYAASLSGTLLPQENAQRIINKSKQYKAAISKALERLERMKQDINKWFEEQIKAILGGKHKIETEGSTFTKAEKSGANVKIQDEIPPTNIDFGLKPHVRTLSYIPPSSGERIVANPDKTTTLLGRWNPDMEQIKKSMGPDDFNVGSVFGEVSENPGGFNFLNVPDSLSKKAGEDFFEGYNKPWMDLAIDRGDDFQLVTIPSTKGDIIRVDGKLLGTYAKELDYLVERNYKPVNVTAEKWKEIKSWFGK